MLAAVWSIPAVVRPLVAGLPGWVSAGLALGGVLAGLIVVVFAVGTRRFPDPIRNPAAEGSAGEARRRAEIRTYLRSIREPFIEDHPVGDRTVPFYLPDRSVAVTFDAKDYFVLERAGTRAVLLEFEVPGASLDARLPFDPPASDAGDRSVAAAYARLGLPPSASAADVRAAYRERAKAAHPDHGGDRETFRRLREAYTVVRERDD